MVRNPRFNLCVGLLAALLATRFAWMALADSMWTGGLEELTFDVLLVAGVAARVRVIYLIALAWEAYTAYVFARGGVQFSSVGVDASVVLALFAWQFAILGVLLAPPLRATLGRPRYRASITSAT
ncbi:hypothetical protein [Solirubrobacter soli]|uniref:hypothetical protein n=1 Tax=Solirubrobacter soli TaxID=363832 RepID=UPI00040CF7DB|nr:hypothetical protein [Solirubrobacter soli]